MNIHDLRKNGCKVKVSHFRYPLSFYEKVSIVDNKKKIERIPVGVVSNLLHKSQINLISPKGGETVISINIDGIEYTGKSVCSLDTNYVNKIGVELALKNILKNILPKIKTCDIIPVDFTNSVVAKKAA